MSSLSKILAACPAAVVALWSAAAVGFAAPDRTPHPERFVRIAAFNWSKARIEEMEANFTITSALPFAVKEVEVVCTHFARSGIEVASARRTIPTTLPARGRIEVRAFDMGLIHAQATGSGCRIVAVSPA
jgi:hypothetical protein